MRTNRSLYFIVAVSLFLNSFASAEEATEKRDLSRHYIANFPIGAWVTLRLKSEQTGKPALDELQTYKLVEVKGDVCSVDLLKGDHTSTKKINAHRCYIGNPICRPNELDAGNIEGAAKEIGVETLTVGTETFKCRIYDLNIGGGYEKLFVSDNGYCVRYERRERAEDKEPYLVNRLVERNVKLNVAGKEQVCDLHEEKSKIGQRKLWHCWNIPMGIARVESSQELGKYKAVMTMEVVEFDAGAKK
jgi:hypothetical protein